MTAQAPDLLTYDGIEYAIVGVGGSGLFDPREHGLQPIPLHTAAWRGFIARYRVHDGRLQLRELTVGLPLAPEEAVPPLFGTTPERNGAEVIYRLDDAPIAYSGTLLVGNGFIHELYVHMGFQAGWKYRRVLELTFEDGLLRRVDDLSERMAAMREEIATGKRPDPDAAPDVGDWIARTFERDPKRTLG